MRQLKAVLRPFVGSFLERKDVADTRLLPAAPGAPIDVPTTLSLDAVMQALV